MALAGTVPAGHSSHLGQMHNLNFARHYSSWQQTGHIGCHQYGNQAYRRCYSHQNHINHPDLVLEQHGHHLHRTDYQYVGNQSRVHSQKR